MVLPTVSIDAVLIDPSITVPPPRSADSLPNMRLGDIALAALVNAAALDPIIQTGIPEEVVSGNTNADNYY